MMTYRRHSVFISLEQSIFDETIDQQQQDFERVTVLKEDTSSTACELTMLILSIYVTFGATCLTVASSVMKSCQQRPVFLTHSPSWHGMVYR